MRKSIFKKIAYAVSFFLITGLFSSAVCCAADNTEPQKSSAGMTGSEPITLRYFCALPPDTAKGISSLSELEFYKDLEKKTNIKISFIHPPADSQLQKYMLMMAAGDLPDIVEFPWIRYPGILDKSVEFGAILKLDSLLEKNVPQLNEILQSDNDLRRQVTSDDGAIYQLPGLNQAESRADYQPLIRGDLLEKLGLAMPETLEEWETVLKQFREQMPGKSPLSFDMTTLDRSNSFIGAYGITRDFFLKDGRVVFGPIEKSYKDLLATFSRWYKNGLIDREFLVLKNTQIKNKVHKGDVGAFIGTPGDMENAMSALKTLDPGYELVPVQNPVLHRGDKLNITSKSGKASLAAGIAITVMNRNPEETLKWLECAYSESVKPFNKNQGPADAAKSGIPNLQGRHNSLMPPVTLTQKENEEVSMIMKDIHTYSMEMFAKFVLGVEPLDKFDKYVEKVRLLGIDRVIQIKQAALYRYDNRLASDRIKVVVNGSSLKMDTNPIIIGGRPLVPVRFIIEALGGSVDWDEKDRSVSVIRDGIKILFKIDSDDVFVNSEHKTMDPAVMLLNDRTYVSAEFISQTFGVKLDWDDAAKIISIEDSQTSLKSYFPSMKSLLTYSGGFEGGGYTLETEMTSNGKVQIKEISTAANIAKVYSVSDDEITLVLVEEENNMNKSHLNAEENRNVVILKAPLKVGTAWENQDGRRRTITGVDVPISTPAGSYYTIEVTTIADNTEIKEYYAKNIGLVKSVYKNSRDPFKLISELIKIESR